MKIKYFIIIFLTIFSFYYTDKIVSSFKEKDPLMNTINTYKEKSKIKPVNAIISNNSIKLGKNGKEIDSIKSYEKMKSNNEFNESLLEYNVIKPSITKENNYDKPITGIITEDKELSFVFYLEDLSLYSILINSLDNKYATIFIDSSQLEKIKKKDNISFGIYSYNNSFNTIAVSYTKKMLKNIKNDNYCLYKDEHFLKVCSNLKINTIRPILVEKNIYNYFKKESKNGNIYQIKLNKNNINELTSAILYLNQKGYNIKNLSDLLE